MAVNENGTVKGRSSSRPIPFPTPRGPAHTETQVSSSSRMFASSSGLEMQASYATTSSGGNTSLTSSGSFGRTPRVFCSQSSHDFLLVSEKVTDWPTLLRYLYEPKDVGDLIDQLKRDYHYESGREICAKVLDTWRRKMGTDARVDILCEVLDRMGRKDVAQELCSRRGITCNFDGRTPQGHSHLSSISPCFSGFVNLATWDIEDEIESVFPQGSRPRKQPKEVKDLITALEDPQITVVSLAGPQNSGKTVTLNLLQKELEHHNSFQMTKTIRIRSRGQVDSKWLAREIVDKIQKAPPSEVDQGSYAERNLIGLLGSYEDLVLILDLSLIAISSNGKSIIDYLVKLRQNEKLSRKLRFVISAMTSLWNTSLFLQSRKALKEIIIQPMDYREAVGFIRGINEAFPKQVAIAIVQKIDCYPFYLKQLAHADIENIFVRDGKEEIVRAIESQFEELNDILFDPNVEEAVSIVFNFLCDNKKALLAQVLTFANCFGLEQAQRVVDHKIDINDSLFNPLCEHGALFLKRERIQSNVLIYRIPKIQGDMLRKIVCKSDQFSDMYHRALSKHQDLYLQLLVMLSNCFMGDAPSKSEELKVLEPFTPSDGVPAYQSLTIKDANERTSRAVSCFKQQRDDVIKSLLYCNHSQENYKLVIGVLTQLNVYYFLTYMLCSHESLKIYRKLKREAKSQHDEDSLVKLNIFIASLCIDANGRNNYLSEANSLYEASAPSLRGNVYAHCMQRMGGNKLVENKIFGNFEVRKSIVSEYVDEAKRAFQEHSDGKEASKVYIAECSKLVEGLSGEFSVENVAQMISTCQTILGNRHPVTCSFLKIKGQILQKTGEYDSAKKIFQKVLDAEEDLLGRHWETARTLLQLGEAIFEKLKFNAEELKLNSDENANSSHPKTSQSVRKASDSKSSNPPKFRLGNNAFGSETEVGVEALEETGLTARHRSARIISGKVLQRNNNEIFAAGIEKLEKDMFVKDDPKLLCGKESVMGDSQKVSYDRSSSTSRDITLRACTYEKSPQRMMITGEEDDSIHYVKYLIKKAAGYFLLASGRCHDAHRCYLKLYEISEWTGRSKDAKKYLAKAEMCIKSA